jgi:outer membrane protein assembly factor BamB
LGGGLLSTAGGLLFSGEINGEFIAFAAKTGQILWHFNTGQQINSQPITYEVNGKEYISLSSGGDVFSFALFQPQKAVAK